MGRLRAAPPPLPPPPRTKWTRPRPSSRTNWTRLVPLYAGAAVPEGDSAARRRAPAPHRVSPPPPLPRTNRTSLVPPLVLSGHAASLTPYRCAPLSRPAASRAPPRTATCSWWGAGSAPAPCPARAPLSPVSRPQLQPRGVVCKVAGVCKVTPLRHIASVQQLRLSAAACRFDGSAALAGAEGVRLAGRVQNLSEAFASRKVPDTPLPAPPAPRTRPARRAMP